MEFPKTYKVIHDIFGRAEDLLKKQDLREKIKRKRFEEYMKEVEKDYEYLHWDISD